MTDDSRPDPTGSHPPRVDVPLGDTPRIVYEGRYQRMVVRGTWEYSERTHPGGLAAIEIGHMQFAAVAALLAAQGLSCTLRRDLGGRDRCVLVHG